MTVPEPRHQDAPQGATVTRLPVHGDGTPVPAVTQARAALGHARAAVAADWKARTQQHGGMVNGAVNWKPPSVAEQIEYARRATWVPPGHEEGLFERAGRRYQYRFGIPGVAVGNAISGVASRGIAAFVTALIATALTAVILCAVVFHGQHIPLVIGGATATWVLLLAYLFVPSREERSRR